MASYCSAIKKTDLHALNNFSSSIDKVSFKKNSMSLGLAVLEKLFTQTPQNDAMSAGVFRVLYFLSLR